MDDAQRGSTADTGQQNRAEAKQEASNAQVLAIRRCQPRMVISTASGGTPNVIARPFFAPAIETICLVKTSAL